MQVTHDFTVSLTSPVITTIPVMQGDGVRMIEARLMEENEPWAVPAGVRAGLSYERPGMDPGYYDRLEDGTSACTINGNLVSVVLVPTLMERPGPVKASIVFRDSDGAQVATFPFHIWVKRVPGLAHGENIAAPVHGFDGKIYYGGPGGALLPLGLGAGIRIEQQEDGGLLLVAEGGTGSSVGETDPTVPAWAKEPQKPSYTAAEVGAEAAGTVASSIETHNVGRYAHNDIRLELQALSDRINAALNSTDTDLDQLSEIVAYIKSNKSLIDAITTSKVSVADIVDNLVTNASNKPLSAAQGVILKQLIDAMVDVDKLYEAVEGHNTDLAAHPYFHERINDLEAGKLDADKLNDGIAAYLAENPVVVPGQSVQELPITDMDGYKIAPTGTILAGTAGTQLVSEPIAVSGGDRLLVTGSAKFGNSLWAVYDTAGTLLLNEVAPATEAGASVEDREVEVPAGAAFFRVAWDKGVSATSYAVSRVSGQGSTGAALPLSGVKCAIIGDSIVEKNATASVNFVNLVAAGTGAEITNLGVGGTGWMNGQDEGNAFYQRVGQIPEDTQRVLLYGSGNDREMPLGAPEDTGTDTLCGCINTALDAVYARVPAAWVGVIAPAPWENYPPFVSGNAMEKLVQAQAVICRRRGVPFLDLYHSSGLQPWNAVHRDLVFHNSDGVHPNDIGHSLIAPQIQAFLLGAVSAPGVDALSEDAKAELVGAVIAALPVYAGEVEAV